MTGAAPDPKRFNNWGCLILVGAVVIGIVALQKPSGPVAPPGTGDPGVSDTMTAGDSAGPAAPGPIDPSGLRRAIKHIKLALGTEGVSGAMIYSQNCYASLGTHFSWGKLDQCGEFDALVGQEAMVEDWSQLPTEQGYFELDPTSARYVAAATSQGLPETEAADRRKALLTNLPSEPVPIPTARIETSGDEAESVPDTEELDPDVVNMTGSAATTVPRAIEPDGLDRAWMDRVLGH